MAQSWLFHVLLVSHFFSYVHVLGDQKYAYVPHTKLWGVTTGNCEVSLNLTECEDASASFGLIYSGSTAYPLDSAVHYAIGCVYDGFISYFNYGPTPLQCGANNGANVYFNCLCYCYAGSYVDDTNDCQLCPSGHYSHVGSVGCTSCPPGQYQDQTGQGACTSCPAGKYQDSVATTSCLSCPVGQYSPGNVDSTECTLCPPGQFQDRVEQGSCIECPSGKYQEVFGETNCTSCSPGRYSPNVASSNFSCSPCPAGEYGPEKALSSCVMCDAGKFTSKVGSINCSLCDAGKYQTDQGQASCLLCHAGKSSSKGQEQCDDCKPGRYSDTSGVATCTKCHNGQVQPHSGETFCYVCEDPSWCLNSTCIEGRTGDGCAYCEKTWYMTNSASSDSSSNSGLTCVKCPKDGFLLLIGCAIAAILFAVVVYNASEIDANVDDDGKQTTTNSSSTSSSSLPTQNNSITIDLLPSNRSLLAILGITMNHLQVSSIYFTIHIKVPKFVYDFIDWFSALLTINWMKFAGPECTLGSFSYIQRFLFSLLVPLVLLAPFMVMSLRGRGVIQKVCMCGNYLMLWPSLLSISLFFFLLDGTVGQKEAKQSNTWFLACGIIFSCLSFLRICITTYCVWRDNRNIPLTRAALSSISKRSLVIDKLFDIIHEKYGCEHELSFEQKLKRTQNIATLLVLINTVYIYEMEYSISSLRCKRENDVEDISQFPPWGKDHRGHSLVMVDEPTIFCSSSQQNQDASTYAIVATLSCFMIFLFTFVVNFGISAVSLKNKQIGKRLRLDLRENCWWWNIVTNTFKLLTVIIILMLPNAPSVQNLILTVFCGLMSCLVLVIRPHRVPSLDCTYREELQLALSVGEGLNIGEFVFYAQQFCLLIVQRLGFYGLIQGVPLGCSLIFIQLLGVGWGAHLLISRARNRGIETIFRDDYYKKLDDDVEKENMLLKASSLTDALINNGDERQELRSQSTCKDERSCSFQSETPSLTPSDSNNIQLH